jgi:hypothetical protein
MIWALRNIEWNLAEFSFSLQDSQILELYSFTPDPLIPFKWYKTSLKKYTQKLIFTRISISWFMSDTVRGDEHISNYKTLIKLVLNVVDTWSNYICFFFVTSCVPRDKHWHREYTEGSFMILVPWIFHIQYINQQLHSVKYSIMLIIKCSLWQVSSAAC